MLVLSRKVGQELVIGGRVRVRIAAIQGKRVRLAIEAPDSISVHREEIHRKRLEFQPLAAPLSPPTPLPV